VAKLHFSGQFCPSPWCVSDAGLRVYFSNRHRTCINLFPHTKHTRASQLYLLTRWRLGPGVCFFSAASWTRYTSSSFHNNRRKVFSFSFKHQHGVVYCSVGEPFGSLLMLLWQIGRWFNLKLLHLSLHSLCLPVSGALRVSICVFFLPFFESTFPAGVQVINTNVVKPLPPFTDIVYLRCVNQPPSRVPLFFAPCVMSCFASVSIYFFTFIW